MQKILLFSAPFGRANKNCRCFLVELRRGQDEEKVSAFFLGKGKKFFQNSQARNKQISDSAVLQNMTSEQKLLPLSIYLPIKVGFPQRGSLPQRAGGKAIFIPPPLGLRRGRKDARLWTTWRRKESVP